MCVFLSACIFLFPSDVMCFFFFFFFKQKTAYEMRISDWSSDVCSSDLIYIALIVGITLVVLWIGDRECRLAITTLLVGSALTLGALFLTGSYFERIDWLMLVIDLRSEEHTSELQSLMRSSYAVFCLKKKTDHKETHR